MANESKKEREEKKANLRAQLEALRLEAETEKLKDEEETRKEIEAARQKLIDDAEALKQKEKELRDSATGSSPSERVVDAHVMSKKEMKDKDEEYQRNALAINQAVSPLVAAVQTLKEEVVNLRREIKQEVKQTIKEGVVEAAKSPEVVAVIRTANAPIKWTAIGAVCAMAVLLIVATVTGSHMLGEYRKANAEKSASDKKGQETFLQKLGIVMKSGRNQTPSPVTSSSEDHSKEKGVSGVNYSTKTLKIFKVKVDGNGNVITDKDGKRLAKFITAINGGFTRTIYFDDSDGRSRLIAVGEGFESEPQEFSDSMWIWKFDDVSNPKGLKTRDTAFVPKQ